MSMLVSDSQMCVDIIKEGKYFSLEQNGKELQFSSISQAGKFLLDSNGVNTVKLKHDGEKSFLHKSVDGEVEIFKTSQALRRVLCEESGGAWIEKKDGKERYFIKEQGWFFSDIKEVDKKELTQNLENWSSLQKITHFAIWVLATLPGISSMARGAGSGNALAGLSTLQHNPLALGLSMVSLSPMLASAQTPIGNEFLVNTNTSGSQSNPAVTVLNNGNFLVVWDGPPHSGGGSSSTDGILGQVFDSMGNKIGGEFQANEPASNTRVNPTATGLTDGGFLIAWRSVSSPRDIRAQFYDFDGSKSNIEFTVNSNTSGYEYKPAAATLNDGQFVVAWYGQTSFDLQGIAADVYREDRTKSTEIQVNHQNIEANTTLDQRYPAIAGLRGNNGNLFDNGYVIVWDVDGQDGSSFGIFGTVINNNSQVSPFDFQVNTYVNDSQRNPSVAGIDNGRFVVCWQSLNQDGDHFGIFGQMYDTSQPLNLELGSEFQINTETTGAQDTPSVAHLSNGNFVVVWESRGLIKGQLYNNDGVKIGSEFSVSDPQNGSTSFPVVVGLGNDHFVVAWERGIVNSDIAARIMNTDPIPVTESEIPTVLSTGESSGSGSNSDAGNTGSVVSQRDTVSNTGSYSDSLLTAGRSTSVTPTLPVDTRSILSNSNTGTGSNSESLLTARQSMSVTAISPPVDTSFTVSNSEESEVTKSSRLAIGLLSTLAQ